MADPRTAKVIEQLAGQFSQGSASSHTGEGEGLGASEEEMNRAMMQYMPLKSLPSFMPITDEQVAGLMTIFRQACMSQEQD